MTSRIVFLVTTVVAAVVFISIAAFALNGGEKEDTDPSGTYTFVDNTLCGNLDGEVRWFDYPYVVTDSITIAVSDSGIITGTYNSEDFGKLPVMGTILPNGAINLEVVSGDQFIDEYNLGHGYYDDGNLFIAGLAYSNTNSFYGAFHWALLKDGAVQKDWKVKNQLEVGSVMKAFASETNIAGEYDAELEDVSLEIIDAKDGLYICKRTIGTEERYEFAAMVADDMLYSSSIDYLSGKTSSQMIMLHDGYATWMRHFYADGQPAFISNLCSKTGEAVPVEDVPDLSGLMYRGSNIEVYLDGTVVDNELTMPFGVMNGSTVTLIRASGNTIAHIEPVSDGYLITYCRERTGENGNEFIGDYYGYLSEDLRHLTIGGILRADDNDSYATIMDLELVDTEDSVLGVYSTDSYTGISHAFAPNAEYRELTDSEINLKSYLTIEANNNGVVSGTFFGYRFVGTFDGEMLMFTECYTDKGNAYDAYIYAPYDGESFLVNCIYLKSDEPGTYKCMYTKVDGSDVGYKPLPETEPVFERGDMLVSFEIYENVCSPEQQYSRLIEDESYGLVCITSDKGLYTFSLVNGITGEGLDLVGFYYSNYMKLIGFVDGKLCTFNMFFHDDGCTCLDRESFIDGVCRVVVYRMSETGEPVDMPPSPAIPLGTFNGMDTWAISDGVNTKWMETSDWSTTFKDPYKNTVLKVTPNKTLVLHTEDHDGDVVFTYVSALTVNGVEYYVDYSGAFSADGKSVIICGIGIGDDGSTYATVMTHTLA